MLFYKVDRALHDLIFNQSIHAGCTPANCFYTWVLNQRYDQYSHLSSAQLCAFWGSLVGLAEVGPANLCPHSADGIDRVLPLGVIVRNGRLLGSSGPLNSSSEAETETEVRSVHLSVADVEMPQAPEMPAGNDAGADGPGAYVVGAGASVDGPERGGFGPLCSGPDCPYCNNAGWLEEIDSEADHNDDAIAQDTQMHNEEEVCGSGAASSSGVQNHDGQIQDSQDSQDSNDSIGRKVRRRISD